MEKAKKPVYKRVWFWLPAAAVILAAVISLLAAGPDSPSEILRQYTPLFEQACASCFTGAARPGWRYPG